MRITDHESRLSVTNSEHSDVASPSACDRIIIVGAGGFGREVLQWARQTWPDHSGKIAGFLSADPHVLDDQECALPILGSPETFQPLASDALLLGIGISRVRRKVAEQLVARGARFLTLIHPTAIVAETASVEVGAILCPFSVVSVSAHVGRFGLLNYHSSLGHDASIGAYSVLSPYATLGGGATLAEDVFMGLHSSVGPGVYVGAKARLSANSCALRDISGDSIVFGVPGRQGVVLATDGEQQHEDCK
jgi:sugar O-acyltransferase (sialic acid O-acetyltransferase NeuD family)